MSIVNIMRECIGKNGDIVANTGKAICSTERMKAYKRGISIGQLAVNSKMNEISCVKEPIDLLKVEDKIITVDAERCQKETVEKIIDNKADYCICLKGN